MIKVFEEYNNNPKVGNFVIMKNIYDSLDKFDIFVCNTIGEITKVYPENGGIMVKYEDIPEKLKYFFTNNCVSLRISFIKYVSKNKEELELKISANKYNL